MLAKYTAFTVLDTKSLTGTIPAVSNLSTSNKDITAVNGTVVSYSATDGTAQANVGTSPIAENTPISFAIHIRNTGTAAAVGNFTVTDVLTNLVQPTGGWNTTTPASQGYVSLTCNGVACAPNTYTLSAVSYNAGTKTITFTVTSAGGSLASGSFMSVNYKALPSGPTGTNANIFRFSNVAAIQLNGTTVADCTGLPTTCPLRTPYVLFFRSLSVPYLKETQ
jgi:uncharacterized protein Veg